MEMGGDRSLISSRPVAPTSQGRDSYMEASESALDPAEALKHIKTLALAAQDSHDGTAVQKHLEMIVALADKALPRKRPVV